MINFNNKITVMVVVTMMLALITFPTLAGPWHPFEGTIKQVEKAKDIIIAECLSDTGPAINGLAPSEVKAVTIIKGDLKAGKMTLYSEGLKSGRIYMLTNFGNYPGKINFATNGELAVVELPTELVLDSIKGKLPVEQVQGVFDARRIWVEGELKKLELEKRLLEKTILEKR